MKLRKIYILVGPSGSGKSTISRQIFGILDKDLEPHEEIVTLSLDDARHTVFMESGQPIPKGPRPLYEAAYAYCVENAELLDKEFTQQWDYALTFASIIIMDNTNLSKGDREKWVKESRDRGFEVIMIRVDVPIETNLYRQKNRMDKQIPIEVVEKHYAKYEGPEDGEFDRIIIVDGGTKTTDDEWRIML